MKEGKGDNWVGFEQCRDRWQQRLTAAKSKSDCVRRVWSFCKNWQFWTQVYHVLRLRYSTYVSIVKKKYLFNGLTTFLFRLALKIAKTKFIRATIFPYFIRDWIPSISVLATFSLMGTIGWTCYNLLSWANERNAWLSASKMSELLAFSILSVVKHCFVNSTLYNHATSHVRLFNNMSKYFDYSHCAQYFRYDKQFVFNAFSFLSFFT